MSEEGGTSEKRFLVFILICYYEAAWLVRLQCIIQEGQKTEKPSAIMSWIRAIDTVADKLLNLGTDLLVR